MSESIIVDDKKQFSDDPKGWYKRLQRELEAGHDLVRPWHEVSKKIFDLYLCDGQKIGKKVSLFTANVDTMRSMLYGKLPKVDVGRRFQDADDDEARVAAEILQRVLNTDIERYTDGFATAVGNALMDRLLPGLGQVRFRYVADFRTEPGQEAIKEQVPCPCTMDGRLPHEKCPMCQGAGQQEKEIAPAVPEQQVKSYEDVETDYVHWEDYRWSPCRNVNDLRWIAFRALMDREACVARFGEEMGGKIPLNFRVGEAKDQKADVLKRNPWDRAEIWEIWDKEHRKVWWWAEGMEEIIEEKDDPLGLDGFFPCPTAMMAHLTPNKMLPRPDYVVAEDLYVQVDELFSRIALLEEALAVRGAYNKQCGAIGRLLTERTENKLIPEDNWPALQEKGGLAGQIEWLPIEVVAGVLEKLREQLQEKIALLYQVTGMSDIMRGQAATNQVTATEQAIKAKFASVRIQSFQDEFAKFASEGQRIRAEIISKHFDPQTIIQRANIKGADADKVQAAVQLIKDEFWKYRIEVKPDSIAASDYAAIKQERVEVVSAMAQYFGQVWPIAEKKPETMPFLLEIAKWLIAGTKGSSTMEGIFDRGIAALQQQPPQQGGDPAQQMELQKLQMEMKGKQQEQQMKLQGKQQDLQLKAAENKMKLQTAQQQNQIDQQKMQMQSENDVRQMQMDQARAAMEAAMPQKPTPGGENGA